MASSSEKDYTNLDHCISGPGITPGLLTTTRSIYPGCHCNETCSNDDDSDIPCSCSIAYTIDRCLLDAYLSESSPPIFECNANCSCNVFCFNRSSQQYSCHPKLDLFHTCNKGMGVRSSSVIPNGSYLGEYVGELLSTSQTMKRLGQLQPTDSCYIVQYKEHLSSNGNILVTNIDATQKGNLLRFINHSCSPNLVMAAVRSNSLLPRLCLFACKDILPGEEVCFSYFGRKGNGTSVATGTKQCFCDSKECIGYLPLMQ